MGTTTQAAYAFIGVAAGDTTANTATVWTRAVDDASPAVSSVIAQVSPDPTFNTGVLSTTVTTSATTDYTLKFALSSLQPNTVYYYRFSGNSVTSIVGKFKTAPAANTPAEVRFGFSGDMDGLMRPYALASVIPSENLDFYVNLGDTIYETASTVLGSPGLSYTNSPAVTSSGTIPTPSSTGATLAQLFADYSKKYREQFLPIHTGGQNGLQSFYAAQGNYTLSDNHELGNKQFINGGAPAGGAVGDAASGAGVDARLQVNDVNTSGTFINKTPGFLQLQQVFLNYQPVADRGIHNVPSDPNTHGTQKLYFAQPWGRNVLYINTDTRSYRDIRIKRNSGNFPDETAAPRANDPGRTMFGATQFAWLKQTLLDAEAAGIPWKFISVSDPIDQIGPIGGSLTLTGLPSFGAGSTYAPVNSDGGKSFIGGYRAERNALLKFIADHQIKNVVFLATDDHQNRINELTYSPTGQTELQNTYVKVPYCFHIVCGPLGATGPDQITIHTPAVAAALANSIAAAQIAAGVEPIGLVGYPGLKNVQREGDVSAAVAPQPVDFYSPDTFNYNTLDVSADGRTLSVAAVGINSTAVNSGLEYNAVSNPARQVFSFQIDAPVAPVLNLSGFSLNRRINKMVQQVTISNPSTVPLVGPVYLVVSSLSGNTSLSNGNGTTANNAPVGNPYVLVSSGDIAPGGAVSVGLQFAKPVSGNITYSATVLSGTMNP